MLSSFPQLGGKVLNGNNLKLSSEEVRLNQSENALVFEKEKLAKKKKKKLDWFLKRNLNLS